MKKEMTEAEAWLILAIEYAANRTYTDFLCLNLKHAEHDNPLGNKTLATIPASVRNTMLDRIEGAIPEYEGGVAYGNDVSSEEAFEGRVLACLLFSEIAADEEQAAGREFTMCYADDIV